MKRFILCLLVILSCNVIVYGWGPGAHGAIANRIMEDAEITYQISRWGLSESSISSEAYWGDVNMPNSGPLHQAQWSDISSLSNFNATWMTRPISNQYAGWLMHNIADTSVPACHQPAGFWYCRGCVEDTFEAQGEVYGTPGWPSPPCYTSRSDYDGNINGFYNNMYSLTMQLKSYASSSWYCRVLCTCKLDGLDANCRRAAFKNAYVTFWWYLAYR